MTSAEAVLRIGFPRILPPDAAVAIDVHRQFQRFERLPAEAQQKIRTEQLARLVSHARRHSPFWRDRLAAATAGREALALHDLPVYWPVYHAISLTDTRWHQRDASRTVAVIKDVPDGDQTAWDALWRALGKEGRVYQRNLVEHDPQALLAWLTEVKPGYLSTTPTMAAQLAKLALARRMDLPLAQIITFGETVKPELRSLAKAAFGAKVTDRYSCEELGWIALQCPKHEHYHVMSQSVLVEILDDAGRPCPPGRPGRVILTGLHSFAMPLIRYDVGDYAEWGEACDCGITLPVIARIWGRERSFIRLPDGSLRLARLTGEYWRDIAPIRDYRVVQYADGLIEAFVTCERPLSEGERSAIMDMLRKVLGHPFETVVTQTVRIEWESRWKREDVMRVERLRAEPAA